MIRSTGPVGFRFVSASTFQLTFPLQASVALSPRAHALVLRALLRLAETSLAAPIHASGKRDFAGGLGRLGGERDAPVPQGLLGPRTLSLSTPHTQWQDATS